jgi:hypothetical protein
MTPAGELPGQLLRLRRLIDEIEALLDAEERAVPPVVRETAGHAVLARFAEAGGRLHKLEAHQVAREIGVPLAAVAGLYRHDPPLLGTSGNDRYLTSAGRAWLSTAAAPQLRAAGP